MMSIVNNEIVLGDAVAKLHRFDVAIGLAANAFITVLAVDERLTVLELEDMLAAGILLSQREPRAIVEDITVLQNLDKR